MAPPRIEIRWTCCSPHEDSETEIASYITNDAERATRLPPTISRADTAPHSCARGGSVRRYRTTHSCQCVFSQKCYSYKTQLLIVFLGDPRQPIGRPTVLEFLCCKASKRLQTKASGTRREEQIFTPGSSPVAENGTLLPAIDVGGSGASRAYPDRRRRRETGVSCGITA